MRKLIFLTVVIVALGLIIAGCFSVVPPVEQNELDNKVKPNGCVTIQDGILLNSNGEVITTDYDEWGYNYQAHIFNGSYHNVNRFGNGGIPWTKETLEAAEKSNTWLVMKWNDAWLSNKDCDGDNELDRHFGFPSYFDSGAWETNHQLGSYTDDNGEECEWNYFVKIVAVPESAILGEPYIIYYGDLCGTWYTEEGGTEIGQQIWGAFAIVQQVENDPCADIHGVQYHSPASPGFGVYK